MTEPIRTDMWCHNCERNFVARIDLRLDGNHVILCPHCKHQHCRVVQNGVVTGDRWDSRMESWDVAPRDVSKAEPVHVGGSVAPFLRQAWMK